MLGATFKVVQSTTFSNFSSAHTMRHIMRLASFLCMVVQNLVDLDALLFEFWIKVVLQVDLAEPPMLVVAVFGKDLSNVAPFYIFAIVSEGPWLRYIFPVPECQLLRVSEDMQPLPLNDTPPLPVFVGFFFTKFYFGLLSMAVHAFFYQPPMESLGNSNGIFISSPIQNIYNLERPNEHIYNLNKFRI
jgi:hypothetical protein